MREVHMTRAVLHRTLSWSYQQNNSNKEARRKGRDFLDLRPSWWALLKESCDSFDAIC